MTPDEREALRTARDRYRAAHAEVLRLRALLRKHGISPGHAIDRARTQDPKATT